MDLIPTAITFVVLTLAYWILQLATQLLSTRYALQLGLAAVSAASGLGLIAGLLRLPPSPAQVAALLGVGFFTLLSVAIVGLKLLSFPANRTYSLKALSRAFASYASPIERFRVRTEDRVVIQALRLVGPAPRQKAVIVCHGGGRSKDIWANVATCELLAEQYDLFTFDWRGHQESDGFWTGDGASKYDLKAIVEHVRARGYERIGVVGWSFGAWIAVIAGAEFKNFDALVAAAPPPSTMREVGMARSAFGLATKWWAFGVRAALKVLLNFRTGNYASDVSLDKVIAGLAPIPLLLVCNEYDTAIGVPAARFQELLDQAGPPKRLAVLKGHGHIYDWPNTWHFLALVRDWLAEML